MSTLVSVVAGGLIGWGIGSFVLRTTQPSDIVCISVGLVLFLFAAPLFRKD